MFTGIITNLGKVIDKSTKQLVVRSDRKLIKQLSEGISIAISGVCLTVVGVSKDKFRVDYMGETAKKTNVKYLKKGDLVNLELPIRINSFLSGHLVQGHVDDMAKLVEVTKQDHSHILKFSIDQALSPLIVKRGSVALNGISLTVMEVMSGYFTVGIIPHTFQKTMLKTVKKGDYVNIEVDILAKYLEKLIKA